MKEIGRKINVLFVLIQLSAGGSERVVLELARNLDKSRFNVYTIFFTSGALQRALGEACRGLFHIHKKSGFDLRAMLQISRIIKDERIDVINAHHYMPFFYSFLGSKILHRRKLIYTEHSVPEVEGFSTSFHKWICNAMLYNTDAVIGVSREIGDAFKKQFPTHSRKIGNVLNGVDVDRFAIHVNRDRVRAEWGILPEHFVIGMVANFRRVKNHVCLIRAVSRLIAIHPSVRLMLVGRGYPEDPENSEKEIRETIRAYELEGRVILTEYREDIPALLKSLDVFCLPSFSEGLPVSILEAMAAGVSVVGSNVRGIREVVFPEETGLLFPSNDSDALSYALERLIKDHNLRESLSQKAFAFVSQAHGIRQWVSTYESLLQRISPFLPVEKCSVSRTKPGNYSKFAGDVPPQNSISGE